MISAFKIDNAKYILILFIWLLISGLIASNSIFVTDKILTTLQLCGYTFLSYLVFISIKKFSSYYKKIIFFYFILLLIALSTNLVNYVIFTFFKVDNFFTHIGGINVNLKLKTFDYIEMFIWYCLIALFITLFSGQYIFRNVKYIFIYVVFFLGLSYLLYLAQPNHSLMLSNYNLLAYVSCVITNFIFVTAIFGLVYSKSEALKLFFLSMIFMPCTQVLAFFHYNYNNLYLMKLAYSTWVLWVLLMIAAFLKFKDVKNGGNKAILYVGINTLECRLVFNILFWAILFLIPLFLLFMVSGVIVEKNYIHIFLFLIIYMCLLVLFAKKTAGLFSSPFEKLKNNINKLMLSKTTESIMSKFSIDEFNLVQDFFYKCFLEREESLKKINILGEKAMQLVHDIRSPASVIMMYLNNIEKADLNDTRVLYSASERIYNISNSVFNNSHPENIAICNEINSIIDEKRIEYKGSDVLIKSYFATPALTTFSYFDRNEFKRVISNLLNNAFDSVTKVKRDRKIIVTVKLYLSIVKISILDNGEGIQYKILNKLNNDYIEKSSKKLHIGFGVSYAHNFVRRYKGSIFYKSKQGNGAIVTIKIPEGKKPIWLANKVFIYDDDYILIFSKDCLLNKCIKNILAKIEVKIFYFYDEEDLISAINKLNKSVISKTHFIFDKFVNITNYLFYFKLKNSIYVTNDLSSNNYIYNCISINTKITNITSLKKIIIYEKYKPLLKLDVLKLAMLDNDDSILKPFEYIAKIKEIQFKGYNNPYELFRDTEHFNKEICICCDFNLNLPINGIAILEVCYKLGFRNLYLVSGSNLTTHSVNDDLRFRVLNDKKDIFNYV